jgi:hypothetical protein
MKNDEKRLTAIDRHRNGVAGAPFYVVLFAWKDPGQRAPRAMVATVFDELSVLSVLDIAETQRGNIEFAAGNSWRGDDFEDWLREQIKAHEELVRATYRGIVRSIGISRSETVLGGGNEDH